LVRQVHGLDLSEQGELSIFPPGYGRDGGGFRLVEDASNVRWMIQRECNTKFRDALTLLMLLDSDEDGKRCAERLRANGYEADPFLLLRVNYPIEFHPTKWSSQVDKLNPHPWDRECWIEELLSPDVHRDFVAMPIEEVHALLPNMPAESEPPRRVIR